MIKYKAVKEVNRKYYKYTDITWTQPILSADGTVGGDSFATYSSRAVYSNRYAYKVFDGNNSTLWTVTSVTSSNPVNLVFYNPKPLKVTNIQCRNRYDANYTVTSGTIQGSDDNSTWNTLISWTNSVTTAGATWDIDLSNNTDSYRYYSIHITTGTGNEANIGEISITATQQGIVESTESDYDFYKDVDVFKAVKEVNRKYYKYTTSNATIVGSSTTINDGIVSGFSSSSYATTPTVPTFGSNPYELVFKVRTSDVTKTNNMIYSNTISNSIGPNRGLGINLDSSKCRFQMFYSSSSGAYYDLTGTTTLQNDTWYYIKAEFTGYVYNLYLSTTGEFTGEETLEATYSSTTVVYPNYNASSLGYYKESSYIYYFNGEIDLSGCYIKINNELFWRGMNYIESTESDYDFYKDVDVFKAVKE